LTGGLHVIVNCTIANNTASQGNGIFKNNLTIVEVVNTIVAGPANGAGDFVCLGATRGSNNLIQNNPSTNGFVGTNTITGVDPQLMPLADNGGPTPTLALGPGSPALNNADPSRAPALDQRGAQRGRAGLHAGLAPDIGAY